MPYSGQQVVNKYLLQSFTVVEFNIYGMSGLALCFLLSDALYLGWDLEWLLVKFSFVKKYVLTQFSMQHPDAGSHAGVQCGVLMQRSDAAF